MDGTKGPSGKIGFKLKIIKHLSNQTTFCKLTGVVIDANTIFCYMKTHVINFYSTSLF